MKRSVLAGLISTAIVGTAGTAMADVRYLAFDADDRTTQALTRGITLEVERGLFGATRLRGLYSTSSRGSATFKAASVAGVQDVVPAQERGGSIYAIEPQGDGRALSRALCPGSEEAWLVVGRVRSGRPLTIHAVGHWPDGRKRHCVALNYRYRGEWARLPNATGDMPLDR
ncbi:MULTISPECIES: hypothetical protein [unclassified Brevundimonas]|uniref:hypothetical protein n=1 Tax=unclassified Brevundimonas TaxID=2622653 RepID=UPI0025BA6EED|nr:MULTISPECIES: hypothetical protein [unclassified Brevundimonas]